MEGYLRCGGDGCGVAGLVFECGRECPLGFRNIMMDCCFILQSACTGWNLLRVTTNHSSLVFGKAMNVVNTDPHFIL